MGEHKKQGKTFFVDMPGWRGIKQVAIHRAPSGHFSMIAYNEGVQEGKSKRITQAEACFYFNMSPAELLEKFKLD